MTTTGAYADFTSVARDAVRAMLSGLDGGEETAAEHVLDGFAHLDVHPDVPDGVQKLSDAAYG